jgi:hypothetical protein
LNAGDDSPDGCSTDATVISEGYLDDRSPCNRFDGLATAVEDGDAWSIRYAISRPAR